MYTRFIALAISSILITIYYFTAFKEFTKDMNNYEVIIEFGIMLVLYFCLYVIIHVLISLFEKYNTKKFKTPGLKIPILTNERMNRDPWTADQINKRIRLNAERVRNRDDDWYRWLSRTVPVERERIARDLGLTNINPDPNDVIDSLYNRSPEFDVNIPGDPAASRRASRGLQYWWTLNKQ